MASFERVLRGEGNELAAARFRILEPLGAGGFGAVYEAVDGRTGQRVAVKRLEDTSAESIARFKHEFRALADCHHENLVGLKELIEQDGRWLIVMELVPGVDLLQYVRCADDGGFDEQRLRGALTGIAEGLNALHAFGIVHRDLKPSNVRVRSDGRAVLLDFGLATSTDPGEQSTHALGLGTVLYMAPEQAGGRSIGPACDLYALGVCLFEALTGRAPFESGPAIKIMLDKQQLLAPRASSFVGGVPADLDELCARLLAADPALRPSAREVVLALTRAPRDVSLRPSLPEGVEEVFAGREAELLLLQRALARTHEGELRVVLVEGESGVGKSELISEFVRRARQKNPHLVTLKGRCYENEQVSYKAFDGCIDELAKVLRRMPEQELKTLLPERAALLGQLFPVLKNVRAIAKASREGISADPAARRLEAFAALAHLLGALAQDRPVVLVLDDLQWADAESFRLLAALCQERPEPPILLAGTVRPREELDRDVRDRLADVRAWRNVEVLLLSGLPREHAKALAGQLLPPGAPTAWLDQIADESQGHPLFISELIQYTQSHDFAARGRLTLEAALKSRIDRLSETERSLLEMVAVAARPHALPTFARALRADLEGAARNLLKAKLLRQRRGFELGCYHDRIRHAVTELIAKTRLPTLHYQLATALDEQAEIDASEQAHHWDQAMQEERACDAYERAAAQAMDALAFSRAALLCGRTLELLGESSGERVQKLRIQRADALAFAGRSGEAARLYQDAAAMADGEARILLRCSAAKHLMLGAKVEEGLSAARSLLQELGFSVPRSTGGALARYAWEALRVELSRFLPRLRGEAATREALGLRVARETMFGVALIHPLAYVLLAVQSVRRALRLDTPIETALAMTSRAFFPALAGNMPAARALIARGTALMTGQADHQSAALQLFLAGITHLMAYDWQTGVSYLERAQRLTQEHCPDSTALLTAIRHHLGISWYFLGEHARFARELRAWLVEARERNDKLATAMLVTLGYGALRHLMNDEPEQGLRELEQSMSPIPNEPYSFMHLAQMATTTYCHLYRGGRAALDFLSEHAAQHAKAFVLRTGTGKLAQSAMRLLALQMAWVAAPAEERERLEREARQIVARMSKSTSQQARATAVLALAQLEALAGRHAQALAHARTALSLHRQPTHASVPAAQYLLGILEGGASGREKCAASIAELRAQGWQNPERALALSAPMLGVIENAGRPPRPSLRDQATLLLDHYEVLDSLGRGGFGAVVAARDVRNGRRLAIKELTRLDATAIARFKHEFRALAELPHENIVQLEALFEHDERWYIAMELLEGVDLLSYVRPAGELDAGRLRRAFSGAARGLSALHRAGYVHRDVKPENVIVSAEGRAVLIDFGFLGRRGDAQDRAPLGSPPYTAPEQARGAPPEPAADVFALGVCLHQALTRNDSERAAQTPWYSARSERGFELAVAPELDDLGQLCRRMLARTPDERPTMEQVLAALSGEGAPERVGDELPAEMSLTTSSSFTGRAAELARLRAAFERAGRGFSLVLVEGESGLGKSALVRTFAALVQREAPELRVLQGRCYENEQVAFKAFDGLVDQLARLLRALPDAARSTLVPKRAALLAQLFPVLGSVPGIGDASKKGLPAEPSARKQLARESFVQLLENLCQTGPLLFVVDDLHWADIDSFDLLRAIARRAASQPLLMICTVRPIDEMDDEGARELSTLRELAQTSWLSLNPLEEADAIQLAGELLGGQSDPARLRKIAAESLGHPLFLRELVEHERRGIQTRDGRLDLDQVLAARLDGLSSAARALLSMAALCDKPYASHVYARSLDQRELSREALFALIQQGLVERRGDKLACHHDRIRRAALSRLNREERRLAAAALASALDRELRADAAERARLWDEAGDRERALDAYEEAGDNAAAGLAFARAAQHYARAIELSGERAGDRRAARLRIARGHALVGAGQSAQAARLFQRAAAETSGHAALRLRVLAAQHLLLSAHVEEGLSASSQLLSEVGLSLAASERQAKLRFAWEGLRVAVTPKKTRTRAPSAQEQLALEALHGLGSPLRMVSLLPGAALSAAYLRRALATGHPVHSARALAQTALMRSMRAPDTNQDALFERSIALASRTGEPALMADIEMLRGLVCSTQYKFRRAPVHFWRALELIQTECRGQPWLLTSARMYLGSAWMHAYDFQELRRHTGSWLEEARAREDRFAVAALAGFGGASLRLLVDEQPDGAIAEVEEAMAAWPKQPFASHHMGAAIAIAITLSSEPGARLLDYLDAHPELETAFIMRSPAVRAALLALRMRALLSAYVEARDSRRRAELLARAHRDQRAAARLRGKLPKAFAVGQLGALHLAEGQRERALLCFGRSLELAAGTDFGFIAGIRYAIARLEGSAGASLIRDEVRAQVVAEGWKNIERGITLRVPLPLSLLESP